MENNLRQLIREKAIHDEHIKRRSLTSFSAPATPSPAMPANAADHMSFLQGLDTFVRSKETANYADLCVFFRQISQKSDTLFDLLCAEVNLSEGSFAIKTLDIVAACAQAAEVIS